MRITIYTCICLFLSMSAFSQIVDIPDPGFKEYLIDQGIDQNGDGEIQVEEAESTTSLSIVSDGLIVINSLVGIKSFSNLSTLNINHFGITEVDVSGMENLTNLTVISNDIWSLSATNCTALKKATISDPYLINDMDFSGCTVLEELEGEICAQDIKLNNCAALKRLSIGGCPFPFNLELDGCENLSFLEIIDFHDNLEFDFSILPALDSVIFIGLNASEIEFINAPKLKFIEFGEVASLRVIDCPEVETILLQNAQELDLSDLPKLSNFSVFSPYSQVVRMVDCPSLGNLSLAGDVDEIYVNNCTSLTYFEYSGGLESTIWDLKGCTSLNEILAFMGPNQLVLDECYSLETIHFENSFAHTYDFSPCINLQQLHIGHNNLKSLVIQNGSMETLTMANADDLENICVDPEELSQIESFLSNLGNTTVNITETCDFASGGKPFKLYGITYHDVNNDSCKTSETTIPYAKFKITDDVGLERYFYSDKDGEYQYNVLEGEYDVMPEILFGDYIFSSFPDEYSIDFPSLGGSFNQDFCFIPSPEIVDIIEVNLIPLDEARPGFDSRYLITYTNTGNVTRGGDIKLTFQDQFMDLISSMPNVDVQEEGFLSWSFEDIAPFETREIEFTMNLNSPMDTPPLNGGDVLNFKAEVGPYGNQTLTVYWSYLNQEIVNSFDPNDKTCLSGNAFDQELVGDYLKYMIRFENTGTAEAVNIVVKDTLDDTKFDVRSLEVISASHEVETELEDNVVKFIFKDIYLPFEDETNDGYVTFKIKTLPSLVLGDDIRNKAEIYFDFNFPIVTNTTSTLVADFTSIEIIDLESIDFEIIPNPAFDQITLKSTLDIHHFEILDVQGKIIERMDCSDVSKHQNHSITHLLKGVYFVKVYSENGFVIKKLIKT